MHAQISTTTYRALAILWVLLIALPWITPNNYWLNLATLWLTNVLLVASLNLLMGYSGQISLAHGAFYGIGAYVSGVLAAKYGVSPWIGLPLALACDGSGGLCRWLADIAAARPLSGHGDARVQRHRIGAVRRMARLDRRSQRACQHPALHVVRREARFGSGVLFSRTRRGRQSRWCCCSTCSIRAPDARCGRSRPRRSAPSAWV